MSRPRRLERALVPLALCAAALALHPTVRAAEAPPRVVALAVTRAPGADACVDRERLAADVARRLGRDPFAPTAPERIQVTLRPRGRGYAARITLVGAPPFFGTRTLTSRDPGCAELGATVALAVAVAIDPLVLVRPDPPATPPGPIGARRTRDDDEERPLIARYDPEPPPPSRPRATASTFALVVGGAVTLAAAPGASAGPTLGAAWELAPYRLELDATAQLLGAGAVPGGTVAAPLYAAALRACRRLGPLDLCATLAIGTQRLTSDDATAGGPHDTLWIAPGVGLAARLPLAASVALELRADGLFPVTRARALVGGVAVWETPPAALALGIGLVFVL